VNSTGCSARYCTESVRRYFITDRRLCGGLPQLFEVIRNQLNGGLDYIQIREKDLSARELFEFTAAVVALRANRSTRILVNERADIAIAAGADGVHLPAAAPCRTLPGLVVARSCHTLDDIRSAEADFVTFSPVFESPGKGKPLGIDLLRQACRIGKPVFALGGVTAENAASCDEAGAAGIAGIRLFM
jgi:thiamine-phosphate pyrophosphorylase